MAKLRAELGWTQARLAERIGLSRVALSHVEAGLSVPSERTVILLAGVFRVEPHDLVGDTAYPQAKAERLPPVAARYTEVEHQLAALAAVLDVLSRLPAEPGPRPVPGMDRLSRDIRDEWRARLGRLADTATDPDDRARLRAAIQGLAAR